MTFGVYIVFLLLISANYTQFGAASNDTLDEATFVFMEDKTAEVPSSVLAFIENLARRILSNGITTLQVPSADPLRLNNLSFSFNISSFGAGNVTFEELFVHGLTNFKFLDMAIRKSYNSANCCGEILSASAKMDLSNIELKVNATGSVRAVMMPTIPLSIAGAAAVNLSQAFASLNVSACSNDSILVLDEFEFGFELNGTDFDFSQMNASGINTTFLEDVARKNFDSFLNSKGNHFIDMATDYVKKEVKKREDNKIYKIISEVVQLIYNAVLN